MSRLRLLLDLEKEVISLDASLGGTFSFPMVSPSQLHGIEINPYAQELAQATIWIGYIQWLRDNGLGLPDEPILKPLDAIKLMDAVLKYDEQGRPVEPEWPKADVIVGNPPFLGGQEDALTELGDKYVERSAATIRRSSAGWSRPGVLLVRAGARRKSKRRMQSEQGCWRPTRFGGGRNRRVLGADQETGDIFWAVVRSRTGSWMVLP